MAFNSLKTIILAASAMTVLSAPLAVAAPAIDISQSFSTPHQSFEKLAESKQYSRKPQNGHYHNNRGRHNSRNHDSRRHDSRRHDSGRRDSRGHDSRRQNSRGHRSENRSRGYRNDYRDNRNGYRNNRHQRRHYSDYKKPYRVSSYRHNNRRSHGYYTPYRSNVGISFHLGTVGYSQYRWAPAAYSFYKPAYGSYGHYQTTTQCHRVTREAWHHGHRELISVKECSNPWDGTYIVQGSERVIDCRY